MLHRSLLTGAAAARARTVAARSQPKLNSIRSWTAIAEELVPPGTQTHADVPGAKRNASRLDGLLKTKEDVAKWADSLRDEEGIFHPPHAMEMPYMTYKETSMNSHMRARRFRPPAFGDVEYKEISDKTP